MTTSNISIDKMFLWAEDDRAGKTSAAVVNDT